MKQYDNPVIKAFQKLARQIVDKLEKENEIDSTVLYDGDYQMGLVRGRTEAIELIKKRFELE